MKQSTISLLNPTGFLLNKLLPTLRPRFLLSRKANRGLLLSIQALKFLYLNAMMKKRSLKVNSFHGIKIILEVYNVS